MLTIRPTYHRRLPLLALITASLLLGFCDGVAGASELVVSGAGDGHGVGMSQEGALGYAEHGASYQAILADYYTGTTLGLAPAGTSVRVLVGSSVQSVPLEQYVRGVVSAEMPASWPLAALEAQAIASRTYALTAHAGGARFDVYADTRSQVYRGIAAETAQTNVAVSATAGQIVLYEGRPATTYFFASSGGMTENIENVFLGSEAEPWLRAVSDPYDSGPAHSWKLTLSFATVGARLKGLLKGAFRGIEVLKRGVSPRIISANLLGSGGRTLISGPELAARLGLDATWAYFSIASGQSVTPEPDRSAWAQPSPASPASAGAAQGGEQAPPAGEATLAGGVAAG
ncbi:MAG: SpoIID/LytB domain-containing protein [Solirubrobacteraceae bacterium]|jgi:stage II sporulation protein D